MCMCTVLYDCVCFCFFLFNHETAYELRISDWSSDVCSSDLPIAAARLAGRCAATVAAAGLPPARTDLPATRRRRGAGRPDPGADRLPRPPRLRVLTPGQAEVVT